MENLKIERSLKKILKKWVFKHLFSRVPSPHRILEIGIFKGISTEIMVKEAKKYREDVEYYGFDIFGEVPEDEPNPNHELCDRRNIENLLSELDCEYYLFEGNTRKSLPRITPDLPWMDFIHIDGGHSYRTARSDWKNVKKLLHENSVALIDDFNQPGVSQAVDEIGGEYKVEILDLIIRAYAVVTPHSELDSRE